MHPSWQQILADQKQELAKIERQLAGLKDVTPDRNQIMRAFEKPISEIKVLLIGQDPYPSPGVAVGLAFAVSQGSKKPQSLRNLMKELAMDISESSCLGDLTRWQSQGVMLMNTSLTTQIFKPAAHSKLWRDFTTAAIRALDITKAGQLVILALGNHAIETSKLTKLSKVVSAAHPSPLSAHRGFFGSRVFSKVNQELKLSGMAPIDWSC